ncbi:MAG: hypothetical protein R3C68_07910 [Myxococcota bacterium]
MSLLQDAEAVLEAMPDQVAWNEMPHDARFDIEVLGENRSTSGRSAGGSELAAAMGPEQGVFVFKFRAAKT